MIGWIVFWIIVVLITIEILSLWMAPKNLRLICECDMTLVEPDEKVTISYQVRNSSFIPVSFVGISLAFDENIKVYESEEWKKAHLQSAWNGVSIGHNFMLLPHHRFQGRVHISFEKRGIHQIDRLYLETGDLFGFRTQVIPVAANINIVCTSKLSEDEKTLTTLGGILGDISVRRFIYEDPSLLAGYNEYTGREPMKQISWLQTAARGKLMVKQNDYTVDASVSVMVDLSGRNKAYLEEVLVLTRTVCEELEAKSIPYELCSNGDLHKVPEGFGKAHLHLILRRIGISKLASYTDFADITGDALIRMKGNRSFIIIAPEMPEANVLDPVLSKAEGRVDIFTAKESLEKLEVGA